MIYEIYIIFAVFFFISAAIRIEECQLDYKMTRSREVKVLLRSNSERARKNLLLSIIWPVIVVRALLSVISHLRSLKSK